MRKGFTVPLILVLVLVLIMVPLIFWMSTNNFNASTSADVMGANDTSKTPNKPGFSVTVNSNIGVWDLLQTGCATLDECKESLSSGKRLATASGGTGVNNTVNVYPDPTWSGYEYLKLYVRSGWGNGTVGFDLEKVGDIPGAEISKMSESSASYDVAIVPLSSLSSFVDGPVFSK